MDLVHNVMQNFSISILKCLRVAAILMIAALALPASAADLTGKPEGAVIVTFTGAIGQTNRGPWDEKLDGFMTYHEIEFKKAFAFDLAMLEKFPLKEIRSQPPQYTSAVTFKGPLLRDVLKALGAENAGIKTRALDGFAVNLTSRQVEEKDWILATRADGKPFGLGDKGPIWLMHTPSKEKVPEEEEQGWPWAVFHIEVTK